MKHIYTGYEAPSTAHENLGHPFLEIGSHHHLELISAYTVLPHSLTLKTKFIPLYYEKDLSISLAEYDVEPVLPYVSHPALERIDLWLDKEGHSCVIKGLIQPLDIDPQWDTLLKDQAFYSMKFDTLERNCVLNETDALTPYGGSFDKNPERIAQLYIKAQLDQDHINLTIRRGNESLKTLIETYKIEIFITYHSQAYRYLSRSYTLSQQDVLIEFIAAF